MVTVCCICQKTKTEQGWIALRHAQEEMLSHGYCPACAERVLEELKEFRHGLAVAG